MVLAFLIILVVMPVKTKDPRKVEIIETPTTNNGTLYVCMMYIVFLFLHIRQEFVQFQGNLLSPVDSSGLLSHWSKDTSWYTSWYIPLHVLSC